MVATGRVGPEELPEELELKKSLFCRNCKCGVELDNNHDNKKRDLQTRR